MTADTDPLGPPPPAAADTPVSDKFTDALGRPWRCRLTLADLERVRRDAGVDLSEVMSDTRKLADLVFGDLARFGRFLWALCETQAGGAGVTPAAFAAGFDGPTLEAAGEAVLCAVADFFPRSAVGRAVKTGLRQRLTDFDRAMVASISKPSAGGSAG